MDEQTDPNSFGDSLSRRGLLSGALGVGAVSLAGCGFLEDGTKRSASPAEIEAGTREQTRFDHEGTEELTLTETVTVGGESRDLELTNYLASYRKTVPAADGGIAAVHLFTTPSVRIAGQEANPLAELDEQQLLGEVASRAGEDGMQDVSETGTRQVPVLGAPRRFRLHEATTEIQGEEVVVRLPVAKFAHEDDLLVVFASYPKLLEETAGSYDAIQGTVHPATE